MVAGTAVKIGVIERCDSKEKVEEAIVSGGQLVKVRDL
jgi:hypothetical protein